MLWNIENLAMITIKYLQKNLVLTLHNPKRVNIPLKKKQNCIAP